jgi:uncharacterized protein
MEKYPSRRIDIAVRIAFVITLVLVIRLWPKAIHVPPSFDCNKATLPTEKAICGDPDLSKIDADFAIYYADSLTAAAIANDRATLDTLLKGERGFLNTRNQCGRSAQCVMQAYANRERQLGELVGLPPPPPDFGGVRAF